MPSTEDGTDFMDLNTIDTPVLLTIAEAADALRCSPRQIYYLIERDELPRVHIGTWTRIPMAGLREWVASRTTTATQLSA